MLRNASRDLGEITFHTFLPLCLIKNGLVITVGAACFFLGTRGSHTWWIGTAIAILVGVRGALSYSACTITLYGHDLIFQFGVLNQRTVGVPIWEAQLDIRQSLLGRIFNYGTVRQQWGNEMIEVRSVAPMSILCRTISKRRQELGPLLLSRNTIDLPIFAQNSRYATSQPRHRLTQEP